MAFRFPVPGLSTASASALASILLLASALSPMAGAKAPPPAAAPATPTMRTPLPGWPSGSLKPVPIKDATAYRLCTELLAALQKETAVTEDSLAFLPADVENRLVVLTWSTGVLPPRRPVPGNSGGATLAEQAAAGSRGADAKRQAEKKLGSLGKDAPKGVVVEDISQSARVFDKNGREIASAVGSSQPEQQQYLLRVHGKSAAATGKGVRAAILAAVRQARSCDGEGLREARFLKVEILQHAVECAGFQLFGKGIWKPDLVGIAFPGKTQPFVLLPDILIYCTDEKNQFQPAALPLLEDLWVTQDSVRQVSEWAELTPSPLSGALLVEMQGWFTDGQATSPMFRGHRMPNSLDANQIRQAGDRAAGFLCRNIRRDGTFACTLPRWRSSGRLVAAGESPEACVRAVLALIEWQAANPSADRAAVIDGCLARLTGQLSSLPSSPGAKCLAEEPFEAGQFGVSVKDLTGGSAADIFHAELGTNALLAAALLRHLAGQPYPAKLDAELEAIGKYLLLQQKLDGRFIIARTLPSGAIRTGDSFSAETQAATALALLSARTGRVEYLDAAEKAMAALFDTGAVPAGASTESIIPKGLQLETTAAVFTAGLNRRHLKSVEKLAAGLLAGQTVFPAVPLSPDLSGSAWNSARLAPAAAQIRGMLAAADICRRAHRDLMAETLVSATHSSLQFLLQGQADTASTLFLPEGTEYDGAFRRTLTGCEFTLEGQADCLRALAAAVRTLSETGAQAFPITEELTRDNQEALSRLGTFPRSLPDPPPRPASK